MEMRRSYYVSPKNALTWIAALLMMGSVGLRIAYFCGKGVDTTTMWGLLILPVAACLIFTLRILLDGKEHFYRTLTSVFLMAVYFTIALTYRKDPELENRVVFLNALIFLAIVVFYRQITAGRWAGPWLLVLIVLGAIALYVYDESEKLLSGHWQEYFYVMPDFAMLLGLLAAMLAVRPHLDEGYHPTWGDRPDGRRVRTMPPMSQVEPYIMVSRNTACNTVYDEIEISKLERYIREKRKEGLAGFGINHFLIAVYVRCVAKYPAINRFVSGQRIYSRGDDIQYCMTVKKEMTVDSPDTCIKLHLKPTDTVYEVYEKMEKVMEEVKNQPLNSAFDRTAKALTMLPGPVFSITVALLRLLDYVGKLPKFLLEVSPFHGSVFFTSMGSLGIPAIIHHLYDFGNLPMFIAFGRKYRRNEVADDGEVVRKKYVDVGVCMDERICDGFYYAAVLKYMHRLFNDPERLDLPPEVVNKDIP